MNPSVSGHYPLLRHDPVTARAISRLSHGVARLTASLNPEGQHRHFRTRRAKLGNRSVSESLSGDDSRYVATGSKRKWQPDKIELDTIMELEQSTTHSSKQVSPTTPSRSTTATTTAITTTTMPPLIPSSIRLKHSSIDSTLRHVSISIDALNLQTKLLTPFSYSNPTLQKSLSSDNIESTGRYSSGSSMLSITTSSDNHNNNNDNETDASSQDADVEDEDHNELISMLRSTTNGRSTFTSKMVSSSRRKLSLFDKHFYDVWKPFDDSVYSCGGDSSDGLSINIKMPRLSSTYFHNNNNNNSNLPGLSDYSSRLSPISSSQSTRRYTRGMLASSSSDTTNHRRRVKCKCKLRNNEHHTTAADCHKSGK
ncbi:unnamed protein product [Trichobilharzia regenti]|nr:unnamed protein product [Trichobilharzia regenti]